VGAGRTRDLEDSHVMISFFSRTTTGAFPLPARAFGRAATKR